jgi:hypothetical protein
VDRRDGDAPGNVGTDGRGRDTQTWTQETLGPDVRATDEPRAGSDSRPSEFRTSHSASSRAGRREIAIRVQIANRRQ